MITFGFLQAPNVLSAYFPCLFTLLLKRGDVRDGLKGALDMFILPFS